MSFHGRLYGRINKGAIALGFRSGVALTRLILGMYNLGQYFAM
jgi:hypothetical protein